MAPCCKVSARKAGIRAEARAVRGPASSMLGRRMRSSTLLLAVVMLTTLIVSALVSVLSTFDLQVLPQAVHRQLSTSAATSINIIGLVNASAATSDTDSIRTSMTGAFGSVPYRLDSALWSDPLTIAGTPAEVGTSGQLTGNAVLTAGTWPASGTGTTQAALPQAVASELHAAVGTVLTSRDTNTGHRFQLVVTGLYLQRQYPELSGRPRPDRGQPRVVRAGRVRRGPGVLGDHPGYECDRRRRPGGPGQPGQCHRQRP